MAHNSADQQASYPLPKDKNLPSSTLHMPDYYIITCTLIIQLLRQRCKINKNSKIIILNLYFFVNFQMSSHKIQEQ